MIGTDPRRKNASFFSSSYNCIGLVNHIYQEILMVRSQTTLLLFFLLGMLSSELYAQDKPCYSYEPSIVKLVGVIKEQTFPGPLNY